MDDEKQLTPPATPSGAALAVTESVEAAASASTQPNGPPSHAPPKFTTGSLLRHILVMTGAGALGLMALFIGDLANLIFLSWLKDEAIVAAVGYGSSILFLTISIGIGLSIAATSLISPAIGARQTDRARRLAVNALLATLIVSLISSFVVWLLTPWALRTMGATGRAFEFASTYLNILVPSLAPLAIGMTASGILRSVGDARRAMNVTLMGAVVNVILDPIFIFGLGWGLEGAAYASALSRIGVMAVGLYGVISVHKLVARPHFELFMIDVKPIAAIAIPAILTNIATPFANAYVTAAVSHFGDSAVAGWTTMGRVLPVAFGAIYALSGTIGPILGQNYGAGETDRMRHAFTLALQVTTVFTAVAWALLSLLAYPLAASMHATGEAEQLIVFYCRWLTPLFVFMGALFLSNAAFNALGRPKTSMILNWGRTTLGTVPFVIVGGMIGGVNGVLAGHMLGGIVFGVLAIVICYRMMDTLASAAKRKPDND